MSNSNEGLTGRQEVLHNAEQAVMKDRDRNYGGPEDNFADIAHLWNWYLKKIGVRNKRVIKPTDVGNMMRLMKETRVTASPHCLDHYVDIAGYAACAWECQSAESKDDLKEMNLEPGGINYTTGLTQQRGPSYD